MSTGTKSRLTLAELRKPGAIQRLAFRLEKGPPEGWAWRCHEISIAMVRSGALPEGARVARGFTRGIPGQHSWVALGDPYDAATVILDPTWEAIQRDILEKRTNPGAVPTVRGPVQLRVGDLVGSLYFPHGWGSIWDHGRPPMPMDEPVELDASGLSTVARSFLRTVGLLDRRGWAALFNGPVKGWPAREIVDRAYRDPRLAPLIPVDVVGMLTDWNPGGAYLEGPERKVERGG